MTPGGQFHPIHEIPELDFLDGALVGAGSLKPAYILQYRLKIYNSFHTHLWNIINSHNQNSRHITHPWRLQLDSKWGKILLFMLTLSCLILITQNSTKPITAETPNLNGKLNFSTPTFTPESSNVLALHYDCPQICHTYILNYLFKETGVENNCKSLRIEVEKKEIA